MGVSEWLLPNRGQELREARDAALEELRESRRRVRELTGQVAKLGPALEMERQAVTALQERVDVEKALSLRYAAELAQIRGSMHEVTSYHGMVDSSPLAMLVADLVRDHENLESRFEAVIHMLGSLSESQRTPLVIEVERILRLGGESSWVPDSPEGL
jgi:hypothetical protein